MVKTKSESALNWAILLFHIWLAGQWENFWFFETVSSVANSANAIAQMNQVKFTCKLEPFQEDAGQVTISEVDLVADKEVSVDFRSLVE